MTCPDHSAGEPWGLNLGFIVLLFLPRMRPRLQATSATRSICGTKPPAHSLLLPSGPPSAVWFHLGGPVTFLDPVSEERVAIETAILGSSAQCVVQCVDSSQVSWSVWELPSSHTSSRQLRRAVWSGAWLWNPFSLGDPHRPSNDVITPDLPVVLLKFLLSKCFSLGVPSQEPWAEVRACGLSPILKRMKQRTWARRHLLRSYWEEGAESRLELVLQRFFHMRRGSWQSLGGSAPCS